MIERKTISVNGILISYLVDQAPEELSTASGQGGNASESSSSARNKQKVIFLHGWRSEAVLWQAAIETIAAEGFRVYALDLPGFGLSGNPPKAFSIADYAGVVEGFMEKLKLNPAVIVGHSFGGRIGIVMSVQYPKSVSKLVLVDSAGVRNPSLYREVVWFFAKLLKPLFAAPFMQALRRRLYALLGAEDYLATPELQETFKLVINEDLQPLLPDITQETLLIWGEYDADTPISFATEMQKRIPNARLVIITGATHFSFLDAPQEFTATLTKFLL